MNHIRLFITMIVTVGAVLSGVAVASDSTWYVGAGLGRSTSSIAKTDFMVSPTGLNKNDNGGKIFVGYRMNRYFALQANYLNFGKVKVSSPFGVSNGHVGTWALSLDGMGILPIGDRLFATAKAGIYRSTISTSNTLVFAANKTPKNTWGFGYGVGAQYNLMPELGVRVDWDQLLGRDGSDRLNNNVGLASMSLVYNFV